MKATLNRGLSAPVLVPEKPNWFLDYGGLTADQLVGLTDEQLSNLDPLAVNLIVAQGIPCLTNVDIRRYQEQINAWAYDFVKRYLPFWLTVYRDHLDFYKCNQRIFEVGMIQQFFTQEVGLSYLEAEYDAVRVRILNPSNLFLDGLLDTLRGTCANMPTLYVAMAWRLGWPVSLACNRAHYFTRYDDGEQAFNVEAAIPANESGGFCWSDDELQIKLRNMSDKAICSGSDLKALTPRERLGAYIMMRARHFRNMADQYGDRCWLRLAERACLLACYLFPSFRLANLELTFLRALLSGDRFDSEEAGHVSTYGQLCWEVRQYENGTHLCQEPMPPPQRPGDSVFIRRSLSDTALEPVGSAQSTEC
jgi:hypothetical protein